MVMSKATSVAEYLAELPADRRKTISAVRAVVRKNLPKGYKESIGYGMICYSVPLSTCPDTYNGQPLCYAALASQKHYCALYLMNVYGDAARTNALQDAFKKAGKKLDMGKSCVRFKTADDLPLDAIGKTIAATPVKAFIEKYEKARKK
jgi:uncharacterized protein YdhG (YjbR/CyaY superfamily)